MDGSTILQVTTEAEAARHAAEATRRGKAWAGLKGQAKAFSRRLARIAPEALLFAPVLLAPMVAAGIIQTRIVHDILDVPWIVGLIGPACLGLAALYCGVLAERTVREGQSALVLRLGVVAYAMIDSASAYWYLDKQNHPWQASALVAFFAASAIWLWDRRSRFRYRSVLRDQGRLDMPLPHFRGLRWVLFPRETFHAFRLAVRNSVSSNEEALALARAEAERRSERREARKAAKAKPETRGKAKTTAKLDRVEDKVDVEAPLRGRQRGKAIASLNGRRAEDEAHLVALRKEFPDRLPSRGEVKASRRVGSPRADAFIAALKAERESADRSDPERAAIQ